MRKITIRKGKIVARPPAGPKPAKKLVWKTTDYTGVVYIEVPARVFRTDADHPQAMDKSFFIRYSSPTAKGVFEKAGRESEKMTAFTASRVRDRRKTGRELSNKERRAQIKAAKAERKGRWTIDKLWAKYKKVKTLKGLVSDENRFRLHISPAFGSKTPQELSASEISLFRKTLEPALKLGSVSNILEVLRRIINFGVNNDLCPPVRYKIKLPQLNNETTRALSPEQVKALLDSCDAAENQAIATIIKVALFSGMRKSEILTLKWQDLDFIKKFITIRNPKSGRDAIIPMYAFCHDALLKHKATLKADTIKQSNFVFIGKDGKKPRSDLARAIKKIYAAVDVPEGFRPMHDLRHTFASLAASSGNIDPFLLQKFLTHRSGKMTARYAHLFPEALHRGATVMDGIFQNIVKEKEGGK